MAYPQMLSPPDTDPPHYPSTPITSAGFGNRAQGSGTGCDPPLKDPLPLLLKKLHSVKFRCKQVWRRGAMHVLQYQ